MYKGERASERASALWGGRAGEGGSSRGCCLSYASVYIHPPPERPPLFLTAQTPSRRASAFLWPLSQELQRLVSPTRTSSLSETLKSEKRRPGGPAARPGSLTDASEPSGRPLASTAVNPDAKSPKRYRQPSLNLGEQIIRLGGRRRDFFFIVVVVVGVGGGICVMMNGINSASQRSHLSRLDSVPGAENQRRLNSANCEAAWAAGAEVRCFTYVGFFSFLSFVSPA